MTMINENCFFVKSLPSVGKKYVFTFAKRNPYDTYNTFYYTFDNDIIRENDIILIESKNLDTYSIIGDISFKLTVCKNFFS